MPTLILSPRQTDDSQALWREAIRDPRWDVERMAKFNAAPDFECDEAVPYGEPFFNQVVSERYGLSLPSPPPDFLPGLPYFLRKRDVELTTLAEARKLTKPAFIKPPNDKEFPARIYESGADLGEGDDDTPVLVQEIVEWASEYRLFFMDGLPCTGSVYMHRGQYMKDEDYTVPDRHEFSLILDFSQRIRQVAGLPHAVVIDIGIIRGRGTAVIEANEVNASGIYGCDPGRILDCLYYAAHHKRLGILEETNA